MSPYDPLKHGPKRIVGPGFHEQVHKLVGTVPPGSVTTYGDIGAALGSSTVARHVGYAMAALPEGHGVPWWRVVRADGSLPDSHHDTARQAYLEEGTALRPSGAVDIRAAFWQPPPVPPSPDVA